MLDKLSTLNWPKKPILIGVITIAVIAIAITAIVFMPAAFPNLVYHSDSDFRIESGDGVSQIADNLKEQGLVKSSFLFKLYAVVTGQSSELKAGLYKVSPNMSISDLVHVFSRGLSEEENITVTIPEGSNINDIDKLFLAAGLTQKGDFLEKDLVNKEGYLFPDTYNFFPEAPLDSIVKKLEGNFDTKTNRLLSGLPQEERKRIIIIASMLEKEVRSQEDMRIVAGIIASRMSLGMRLEIDATSAYGECVKSFISGRNCETSEVNLIRAIAATDSPYNTYRISGLPVGPISNPGIKAIEAALRPTDSEYLFYLTDKAGKVYYARNAAEHSQNRALYLNR